MRWMGMLLGGLLLGAAAYVVLFADAGPGGAVAVSPVTPSDRAQGADAGSPTPGPAAAASRQRPTVTGPAEATRTGAGAAQAPRTPPRATPPAHPTGGTSPTAAGRGAGDAAPLPSGLVVPVQGVAPSSLTPTFDDDRGEGRVHEALDIMAPAGTPVLAVADGHVEKLFDSDRGGLTIYQFEPTGRYAYYYAHLERYAPGLEEGRALRRGEVIGYVGSTGNADPAAPHLHFAIFRLGPEKRWWEGTPVDPWPLLTGRSP